MTDKVLKGLERQIEWYREAYNDSVREAKNHLGNGYDNDRYYLNCVRNFGYSLDTLEVALAELKQEMKK